MVKFIVAFVFFSFNLYLCKEKISEIPNQRISFEIKENKNFKV